MNLSKSIIIDYNLEVELHFIFTDFSIKNSFIKYNRPQVLKYIV